MISIRICTLCKLEYDAVTSDAEEKNTLLCPQCRKILNARFKCIYNPPKSGQYQKLAQKS